MHSFLVAEWKTMVAIAVFCGGIFAWFYVDECQKEAKKDAPHVYTCLGAGAFLKNYHLGSPLEVLAHDLDGFQKTQDEALHLVRYARQDGAIALNFRNQKLTAIEYYPKFDDDKRACLDDIDAFKQAAQPVAQSIRAGHRVDVIYDGLIHVQEREDSETEEGADTLTDVGWIVKAKESAPNASK